MCYATVSCQSQLPVPDSLTATEITLLQLLVQGKTVSDIAARRPCSTKAFLSRRISCTKKWRITHG